MAGQPTNSSTTGLSQDDFDALVKQHDGVAGVDVVDPMVADPDFPNSTALRTKNPNPQYKYNFKDGTSITLRAVKNGNSLAGYEVTNAGTALKGSSTANRPITRYNPATKQTEQWDASTNQWVPAPGMAGEPTVTDANGNQVPVSVATYESNQAKLTADQKQQQWQDSLDQAKFDWQQAQAAIANAHATGQLSLDQAKLAADQAHNQIMEQLTARGQNLDFASKMSDQTLQAQKDFIPEGQWNALQSAIGGIAKAGNVPFTPMPATPIQLDPTQIAMKALAAISPTAQAKLAATQGAAAAPAGAAPTAPTTAPTAAPQAAAPAAAAPTGFTAPTPMSPQNRLIQVGGDVAPTGPGFLAPPPMSPYQPNT